MRGIEDTSVLGVGLQSGVGQLGIGYLGVRGEGLDADGLSLDLQFATDKTLAARKGPTPVFTRASTATFVGSDGLIQSAAVNAARFDHDPVTLASRGLLIEESRTNVFGFSQAFTNVNWNKTRSSITANAATAPDGTLTAAKLVEDTTVSNTHTLGSSTVPAVPATFSVFAKKGERNWIVLRVAGSNDFFDLDTGVATTNVNSPRITALGNGWYRCSVVALVGTQSSIQMSADGITTTYTGDGTSGIFVWGAQFETGSFPTSYIPTTTAALARSAEVCSITGSAFSNLWNTSGGTFLFEGFLIPGTNINLRMLSSGAQRRWLYVNQPGVGTVAETLALYDGTSTPNYFTNVRIAVKFKMAISVEALACKASFNGSAISTQAQNGNLLNSVTLLGLFENASGFITGVKYYRKNLSNQKLQTLTAP